MLHNRMHYIVLCIIILSIAGVSYAQDAADSRRIETNENTIIYGSPILIEQSYKLNAEKLDLYQSTDIKKVPLQISISQTAQAPPDDFKVKVDGHIGPMSDNQYNLGSNSARWRDVFVGPHSIHIGTGPNNQAVLSHSNTNGLQRLLIDVDDDGTDDFYFETGGALSFFGPLQPNQDAGDSSFILQSKGSSDAPQWIDVQDIAWSKKGNTGTDTTRHFVGTRDNKDLVFRTNNIIRSRIRNSTATEDSGAFEPYKDNTYSLGTPTHRWKELYLGPSSLRIGSFANSNVSGQSPQTIDEAVISYSDGILVIDKNIGSTGMVPNNTDVFTLGTSDNRWSDLFLGGNSLHIGSPSWEAVISYDTTAHILKISSNGDAAPEVSVTASGVVSITNLSAGGLVQATPGTGALTVGGSLEDYESNLTFSNGLTRNADEIKLGGALSGATTIALGTNDLTLSSTGGRVGIGTATAPTELLSVGSSSGFQVNNDGAIVSATGIASSGGITFSALSTGGIVKAQAATGDLTLATVGTDYEVPLTFSNGLSRTANNVALGGALAATTTITTSSGNNLIITGGGKVGIGGATSPNTTLDIGGDVAVRFSNLSLSNGANTSVSIGSSSAVRITGPTTSFELHGIASGYDGKIVDIYNASGQTMTLMNESATEGTAANRITTGTGAFLEMRNKTMARLVYNATDSRWIVTSSTRNTSNMTWNMKTYSSFGTTNQNAWAPDYGFICHRVSASGNINMTGINSGSAQDGTVIVIINTGTNTITLQNESSNATSASYRILTGTGNNEQLTANKPATLVYDATSQRWRVISSR